MMSTPLFQLNVTGFVVCKEKTEIRFPRGSRFTDSSNLRGSDFFHSWIKFLVSMIAVYPQQSQTPTLKPAQW